MIKTEKKGKWLVFYINGRLDIDLSQELEVKVLKCIDEGANFILFNLQDVSYMSSSGLRVFISSMRKLEKFSGEIRLSNMTDSVRKILQIVDLEGLFKNFKTEEDALK